MPAMPALYVPHPCLPAHCLPVPCACLPPLLLLYLPSLYLPTCLPLHLVFVPFVYLPYIFGCIFAFLPFCQSCDPCPLPVPLPSFAACAFLHCIVWHAGLPFCVHFGFVVHMRCCILRFCVVFVKQHLVYWLSAFCAFLRFAVRFWFPTRNIALAVVPSRAGTLCARGRGAPHAWLPRALPPATTTAYPTTASTINPARSFSTAFRC